MAYLEFETPDGSRRVTLERDRLSIGRLSYNDVALPYGQVSRQHAEMRRIDGRWWIADLHSTNGLRINAHRLQEQALVNGDRVVLAPGISFRFVDETQPAQADDSQSPFPSQTRGEPWSWADRVAQQVVPAARPELSATPPRSVMPARPATPETPPSGNGRSKDAHANYPTQVPEPGQYPMPWEPPRNDPAMADPFRRDGAQSERNQARGIDSALLHVCQTCGQLTAPNAVYCQSCHHSIAQECPNCRLSLLPIQERCPRCHTPNAASVRRAHPQRTSY